ncbi:hypothetical protein B1R94_22190 [Mycolicibacterium litorale]|nr:hypothetical protein B1R94_22190 [Mycolicibacterium litorale]
MSIPRQPADLGAAGAAFWTSTLTRYWMDGEPHKLAILEQACRVLDRIAELEAGMTGQPLTVWGSKHQPVIHPLIAEKRFQQGLFASLTKALGLPDSDEDDETEAARLRSERARHAANVRWKKEKPK